MDACGWLEAGLAGSGVALLALEFVVAPEIPSRLLVSSEREEGWIENLPAEVFFVDAFVDAACALSEGAEEVLALDDEAAEEDVDGLDWELSFVEVEEVPEEAFEGLLDEGLSSDAGGGGGDDVAGEQPSTSSAYCCKISRCRLVSERGMLTSNCTIKSPF